MKIKVVEVSVGINVRRTSVKRGEERSSQSEESVQSNQISSPISLCLAIAQPSGGSPDSDAIALFVESIIELLARIVRVLDVVDPRPSGSCPSQ